MPAWNMRKEFLYIRGISALLLYTYILRSNEHILYIYSVVTMHRVLSSAVITGTVETGSMIYIHNSRSATSQQRQTRQKSDRYN